MSRTVSLSLLDRIEIASPCSVEWDSMTGDDRSRFCGQCKLHVYNIAAMTREEAEAMILEGGGSCVRLFRRHDGTVLTRDCPVGLRAVRVKAAAGLTRVGAACALLLGSTLTLAGAPGMGARVRSMQPFAMICQWLAPAAPPAATPVPTRNYQMTMGARCPAPRQPSTPASPSKSTQRPGTR